jgi:DNA-binding beta-propeller fold protein YncE
MEASRQPARCTVHRRIILAFILLACGAYARAADSPPLERVQIISLRGPDGRLDHLALDARGGRLFVANMANSSLDVVDLKQGKLLRQIPGQKGIQGIAYAPDLDRIFVGNGGDGVLNTFDGRDYQLLGAVSLPDADNVRYESRTQTVYVAHAERAIAAVDAKALRLRADIPLPGSPEAFQLEKERPRLYVNTPSGGEVAAVDTDRRQAVSHFRLTLARDNYPLALDEAGHRLFVGARRKPMLIVLDTNSGREMSAVSIPGDVDDLFFDATNKRIYASCGEGFLAVLRQTGDGRFELEAKIPTIKLARTCLFDPQSGRLYLVVPRHAGAEGPQVWVYRARDH